MRSGSLPERLRSGIARLMSGLISRAFARPHLFQIVEVANLGPEHVDNDVTRVDQHPIASIQAFNPWVDAVLFELAAELIGDRTDMTV